MDKRFNRTAMFFSTLFLVMLVFAVAAFFYGLNLGTKKTESKYAHLIRSANSATDANYTIQQQDLASFQLTVYSPYREFQITWNDALTKIANHEVSNVASLYKELEGQASKKAADAASFNLQHAGVLGQAQQNYIRSLNQFEKVAKALQKSENASYNDIMNTLSVNEAYEVAVSQALKGQETFYLAMYEWGKSVDPNIPSDFDINVSQNFATWSNQPLLVKNRIVAKHLNDSQLFTDYLPHDLVSNIDTFIESGKAESMSLGTLDGVIKLLTQTSAVRNGDYNIHRNKLYAEELLPQISLFYPNVD